MTLTQEMKFNAHGEESVLPCAQQKTTYSKQRQQDLYTVFLFEGGVYTSKSFMNTMGEGKLNVVCAIS